MPHYGFDAMEVIGEIAVAVDAMTSPSLPFVELPISLILSPVPPM
jgi:hypothetical protein